MTMRITFDHDDDDNDDKPPRDQVKPLGPFRPPVCLASLNHPDVNDDDDDNYEGMTMTMTKIMQKEMFFVFVLRFWAKLAHYNAFFCKPYLKQFSNQI